MRKKNMIQKKMKNTTADQRRKRKYLDSLQTRLVSKKNNCSYHRTIIHIVVTSSMCLKQQAVYKLELKCICVRMLVMTKMPNTCTVSSYCNGSCTWSAIWEVREACITELSGATVMNRYDTEYTSISSTSVSQASTILQTPRTRPRTRLTKAKSLPVKCISARCF